MFGFCLEDLLPLVIIDTLQIVNYVTNPILFQGEQKFFIFILGKNNKKFYIYFVLKSIRRYQLYLIQGFLTGGP